MTDATPIVEEKKAAPKKAAAKKSAVKEAVEETSSRLEAVKERLNEVKGKLEEAGEKAQKETERFGLAYIGLLGSAYDAAAEQVEKVNKKNTERFEDFIKRGETLRSDAKGKIDDIQLPSQLEDVKAKFDELELPKDFDAVKEKFNEVFEDVKSKLKIGKAA